MMGKIMKRNDFGKIVNYTMKGNNKSKLLATEGVRSDSKQHIAESFSCQAGLNPNRSLGFLCVVRQREIL